MRKLLVSFLSMMMLFSLVTLPVLKAAESNVALNKPITASSVESAMASNTADKAIDGSLDTRWSCNAMKTNATTENDAQTPQWLIIDLEAQSTSVSNITIHFFRKVWASQYEIQTADTNDENTVWENVKSISRASGSVADNYQEVITDVTSLKRYVRFYFQKVNVAAGGTGVSVSEISITGTQSGLIEQEKNILDYHRTFENGSTDGLVALYGSGASLSVLNNQLNLSYTTTRSGIVDNSIDHRVANGTFEATLTPVQDSSRFGMILRANDANHKILVGTENASNKWFWEYWNGSDNKWSTTFDGPSLSANQEVTIKVKLLGNRITLWVNGTQVFSETMSGNVPMTEGFFGFDKNTSAGSFKIKSMSFKEQLDSASIILGKISTLDPLTKTSTKVEFPEVSEDYQIKVIGSTNKHVIDQNGNVTNKNIQAKEVEILVEVAHKEDESDRARKNFTLNVPAKTDDPLIFPNVNAPNEKPEVLPALQEWYGTSGSFEITENTLLQYNDVADINIKKALAAMNEDLKDIKGYSLKAEKATEPASNSIYFVSDMSETYDVKEEGYYIEIKEDHILVHANTYTGILYATVTLEQMMTTSKDGKLACGIIRDYPDYEIRGVMFDVGRIPHRLSYLQDYTRILKWYKLNEFHLHLNDDFHFSPTAQSTNWNVWSGMHRLESDIYPSLIERQIYTGEQFKYFNEEYADPTYTKEEFVALTHLANDNGIDLIAELDTPSHATAYIEYAKNNPDQIPWLGEINTTTSSAFNNSQMLALDIYSNNATEKQHALNARKFIEELYKDYLTGDQPTFLSDTVHVGADEYWDKSNPEAFRDYTNFLANLMASYGKTARMWGAQKMFPGSTKISPDNIVLDVWATYEEDPNARLAEGYRVVNVPQPYLYTTPGRDHKDMIGEEYLFEQWDVNIFNGDVKAEPGEPLLLGAKAALWGDEFREGIVEADLHERMLRAAAMTAEKTWGGREEYNDYLDYQMIFDKVKEGPNTRIAHNIESKTSLVASYDFANVEGNVVKDTSGNGYDAQFTNGTIETIGNQTFLTLNGNGVVTTPLETIGYPYTVSFDVKANGDNKDATLFEGYDGKLLAQGSDGSLTILRSFFTQSSGISLSSEVKNITIVGTSQNTKMYVNGVLTKMFANVDETGNPTDYWSTFVLPLEKIANQLNGSIGNIKVYDQAFNVDMIHQQMNDQMEVNVALNKNAYGDRKNINAPGLNTGALKRHPAWKAVDGDKTDMTVNIASSDPHSYYLSSSHSNDTFLVDLGDIYELSGTNIVWNELQHATAYKILVSEDGDTYQEVLDVTNGQPGSDKHSFTNKVSARFVKFQGVTKNAEYYGIREFEVYAPVDRTTLKAKLSESDSSMRYLIAQSIYANPSATQKDIDTAIEILQKPTVVAPEKVTNVKVVQDSYKDVTLTWDAVEGAASYDVYRKAYKEDSVFTLVKTLEETTLSVSGLMTGKEYSFYVVAKNEAGVSPDSDVVAIATQLEGKPTLSIEQVSKTKFTLSWSEIDGATRYIIYRKRGDDPWKKVLTLGAEDSSYTTSEMPKGEYSFIVKAGRYDSKDRVMTASSNTVKGTSTYSKPAITLTAGTKQIKVSWKAIEGVKYYEVFRATSEDGKYTKLKTTTATSFTAKSLTSGKRYYFKVRGYKSYNNGEETTKVYTSYSAVKYVKAK